MWMKIQRVKTVIYSVTILVAASSLMPIANYCAAFFLIPIGQLFDTAKK